MTYTHRPEKRGTEGEELNRVTNSPTYKMSTDTPQLILAHAFNGRQNSVSRQDSITGQNSRGHIDPLSYMNK